MTKRREPLTYHRTLTMIAAAIGWDRCAAICGVSERAVRLWSDPDCETEVRLIDAERLDREYMERGGDHAPFHRLMAVRLDIASATGSAPDLIDRAAAASKESGEAVSAMLAAAQAPTPINLRAARQEGEEALQALTSGLAAIDLLDEGPK